MPFNDEFMRELLATFAVEAQEHLQTINQHLLVLEKGPPPEQAAELLAEIFRAAHSLKGAARSVNLEAAGTVAHRLETLFAHLRDGQITPSPALFDLFYATLDALGPLTTSRAADEAMDLDVAGLVARLDQAGGPPVAPRTSEASDRASSSLAQRLQRSPKRPGPAEAGPVAVESSPAMPTATPESAPANAASNATTTPAAVEAARPASDGRGVGETTVRLATAKLDALMEVVGELQAARLSAEQRLAELRAMLESAEGWEALSRAVRRRSRRLRLAAANGRFGHPAQAAVEAQGPATETAALLEFLDDNDGRVRAMRARLSDLRRQFQGDGRHLAQLMADLQGDVRRTRLLPISTVLGTFPRVVRDLARELEKEVSLEVVGGETEVDRAMLEQIKDPLTHLVRNALDHGLESRAARQAAGKPASGTLTLRAAQLGDSLRIEVADDGAGIDAARVKASAVQRGLLTAEAAAAMSEREALWLIFRSGLSTSSTITAVSGRGVGLDVVRENVERLSGWIDVDSTRGQGTRFSFSLPLTVATTQCLLAQAGGQTFGLPISSVVRVVRVGAKEIGHAEGGEAIQVGGRPVALMRLAEVLGMDTASGPAASPDGLLPAIVVGSAERRAAFLVEALGEAQEVVVKGLPQPLLRVQHMAGAAILGSGRIALILNAADLLRAGRSGGRTVKARLAATTAAPAQAPVVLVADDSITTRTLEKNILEAAGYQVRVAADGVEAWTVLQSEPCQLLVSDISMPRMDGFALTEKVRADAALRALPIVLVTSLDSREDRERGIWAGADAYIVKGGFDQDVLLSTIRKLI